jgi:hypothetical protein
MVWTFIKTTLLISILTGILFGVSYFLGLTPIAALGFALFMNLIVYWFSDKFVLKMGGGHLVTEQEAPRLYEALRRLSAQSGTAMPKVALVNNPVPNAFATGRSPNNATVAVHTGLLNVVDDEEPRPPALVEGPQVIERIVERRVHRGRPSAEPPIPNTTKFSYRLRRSSANSSTSATVSVSSAGLGFHSIRLRIAAKGSISMAMGSSPASSRGCSSRTWKRSSRVNWRNSSRRNRS